MTFMQKLEGCWKLVDSSNDKFDEQCNQLQLSDDQKTAIKQGQKDMKVQIAVEGNGYSIITTIAGKEDKAYFELGKFFTTKNFGLEVKNKYVLDGDSLVGEHQVKGQTTTSRRTMADDGRLIIGENTVNGITSKSILQKL